VTIAIQCNFHHDIKDQGDSKICLYVLDRINRQIAFPICKNVYAALPVTSGLLLCWRDGITMGSGSLSTIIGLKEFFSAFVVIFSFIISIGFSCRLDINKCQHSSKPWTLAVNPICSQSLTGRHSRKYLIIPSLLW
jgi:hypothetical protein